MAGRVTQVGVGASWNILGFAFVSVSAGKLSDGNRAGEYISISAGFGQYYSLPGPSLGLTGAVGTSTATYDNFIGGGYSQSVTSVLDVGLVYSLDGKVIGVQSGINAAMGVNVGAVTLTITPDQVRDVWNGMSLAASSIATNPSAWQVDAMGSPVALDGFYGPTAPYSLLPPNAPSPVDYFSGVNPMGDYTGHEPGPLYSLQDPNAPSPVDYFSGVNPMGDYTGFDTNPFNSATVYPGAGNVWSGNGWSGDGWDVPGTSLSFGSGSGGSSSSYDLFDTFGAQGVYDTGSINQLTTYGTDPSNAWASASDWSSDPVMGAGFDWTATDVAGVGFDSNSDYYSGGYTSDATQSYTPYETTNTIFARRVFAKRSAPSLRRTRAHTRERTQTTCTDHARRPTGGHIYTAFKGRDAKMRTVSATGARVVQTLKAACGN